MAFIGRWFLSALLFWSAVTPSPLFAAPREQVNHRGIFDVFVPKRPINTQIFGLNAFVNDPRFGTIGQQFKEVRSTLGVRYVRILFAWNDQVQPTPNSAPNFSFYDNIAKAVPANVEALVILTDAPSWMADSRNWVNGNPRTTFVEKWVKPVITRYKKFGRLKGFEIWNEPNWETQKANEYLDLLNSPENYVELLDQSAKAIRAVAPKRTIVSASTTAINQDYPDSLNYNKRMVDAGAAQIANVYGIHYYGSHYENVLWPDGIEDFLDGLSIPIWLTESGEKGTNSQRAYVERTFPFLKDRVPQIKRTYYYQFTESTPASSTYGLRNLTPGKTVSDLYIYLREKQRAAVRARRR